MNGYDIDGVLVPQKVQPQHPCVVISGRHISEIKKTREQLDIVFNGNAPQIYLRPFGGAGDHRSAGIWKATIINLARVTEFWEDTEEQAAIIRERCPHCLVHMVK